jgi:hypothetical protein
MLPEMSNLVYNFVQCYEPVLSIPVSIIHKYFWISTEADEQVVIFNALYKKIYFNDQTKFQVGLNFTWNTELLHPLYGVAYFTLDWTILA